MDVSRRDWLAATALFGMTSTVLGQQAAPAKTAPAKTASATTAAPATAEAPLPGALSEETLGKLLEALGLKPQKNEKRFDFAFSLKPQGGEDWNLSMSAVLSADGRTLWVMAWLDELPRSSRDVPRTALLRLLSENDQMGMGKFFSYIPTNRRFTLQRVVENSNMTTRKFHAMLVDLGNTVIETYGTWSVETWKESAASEGTTTEAAAPTNTPVNQNTTIAPAATTTNRPRTATSTTTIRKQ